MVVEHVGGFFDVKIARLAIRADAIPIEDAVGEITRLLCLEEDDPRADRVQRARRKIVRLARAYRHAAQDVAERSVSDASFVLRARRVTRPTKDELRVGLRGKDVPALGLSVRLMFD